MHIPITGPGGQAEVAPVPGKSQVSSINQLGAANSGTTGSGGQSALGQSAADNSGNVTIPADLHCFGNPPRQTPDPLSPPCVSGWRGNNGGATSTGISANTIKVIWYYSPPYFQQNGQQSYTDTGVNYTTSPISATDPPFARTIKTYIRYFQNHFETYGRRVDVIAQDVSGYSASAAAADAHTTAQQQPFMVFAGALYPDYFQNLAADHVIGFPTALDDVKLSRSVLEGESPYIYSFEPDLESYESSTAGWICTQLVGRPAAHAADPTMTSRTRKFALVYDPGNYYYVAAAKLINDDLRTQCGLSLGSDYIAADPTTSYTTVAPKLQSDGVTTVICECDSQDLTNAADSTTPPYRPEWVFNNDTGLDKSTSARTTNAVNPAEWGPNSFGVTWLWHIPPLSQTYWYQAYASLNSDGNYDTAFGPGLYESLQQVFTAIQRAGPRPTVSTVQAGLESFSRPSPGPDSPYGAFSPGDHSFIKDSLLEWWNPTASPPGGVGPELSPGSSNGCYIQVGGGTRWPLDGWPPGDHANVPGTCSADWGNTSNTAQDIGGA